MSKELPLQVSDLIVKACVADTALRKRVEIERKASNAALWALIHTEYPDLEVDTNYMLDCEYAEQGVVMLKETEPCSHGMPDGLRKLLDRFKDTVEAEIEAEKDVIEH